jgi:phosphate starvation-inducible protein PhoH
MTALPTLAVVSGPLGAGKTTLAHRLAERALAHERFQRVALNVPSLEVDTTDGYRPGLGEIAGFVTG